MTMEESEQNEEDEAPYQLSYEPCKLLNIFKTEILNWNKQIVTALTKTELDYKQKVKLIRIN